MPRSLALWMAFTTAGSIFALVLLLAAVVLGTPGSGSGAQSSPTASAAQGPARRARTSQLTSASVA